MCVYVLDTHTIFFNLLRGDDCAQNEREMLFLIKNLIRQLKDFLSTYDGQMVKCSTLDR